MGYTTKFSGAFNLSRPLTIAEAKELMDIYEEGDATLVQETFGVKTYLQWVPTETLDAIVWDGEEKFYDYEELLLALLAWLGDRGIRVNGRVFWSGEDTTDTGELIVENSVLRSSRNTKVSTRSSKPLTLAKLAKIALEMVASQQTV